MFSKKNIDVKKSALKIQDTKKDLPTRVKHLRTILDNVDTLEAKGLFETNFSHIYNILYETFVQSETNLRQRELSFHLVHKAHKEELESALWILEQVLSLLPELIHKRWQVHSLGRILAKLLHPGNTTKLRRQAVKYFLMWYQALNDNAPDEVHRMFGSLVPGFGDNAQPNRMTGGPSGGLISNTSSSSVFHDTNAQNPVSPCELSPILPPSGTEQGNWLYLEVLLENMVGTVVRLEWHDKTSHHHRSFQFLLERFKIHYLPKLCPGFNIETSLYRPNLDMPKLRKPEPETDYVACRVAFIKWLTQYTHQTKRGEHVGGGNIKEKDGSFGNVTSTAVHEDDPHESAHTSLDSNRSRAPTEDELAGQIVRDVVWSTRDNVNFLHEMYRQAFLLNFGHTAAIRKTIAVYKDLIQMNVVELPPYVLEPGDEARIGVSDQVPEVRLVRLRNDSYLGAIHKENLLVRAGMQNVLQLFMTHAANVFLLEIREANPHVPTLLEEQTDACKRVLNIYRYMVMHSQMDNSTWEQLLLVLLQITSVVLEDSKRKTHSLGGKLAPAIFQTLIVTWIKANLNVMIARELWDRFLGVLTSLNNWEELVKEWGKTLETLTRVLARNVYKLDLSDLPLDRLSEQKTKKTRRGTSKAETAICSNDETHHPIITRQNSSPPKIKMNVISRSYSETNLAKKRNPNQRQQRRYHSLESLRQVDVESTDRTRSPSPAPSSGLESTSIKDAPIQLDVLAGDNVVDHSTDEEHKGVVCGGNIRGWLPDVAVILWRRMLGALGDVNKITNPKLHALVFDYLIRLTDTLIRIKFNQGVSPDNQYTPLPPELVPPLTLILPWCFGALTLPAAYEAGKLSALRLLCTVTIHSDHQHRNYLHYFYRSLHFALTGSPRSAVGVTLRYLGPRFLSLGLPGSSILLLDVVRACDEILSGNTAGSPRSEAVSMLGGLLNMPDSYFRVSVLRPDADEELRFVGCPEKVREHAVAVLLRCGRTESTGTARCLAITALGHYVYRELARGRYQMNVAEAMKVILLCLKFNHKTVAQIASNTLFLLCDYAAVLWEQYPRLANAVVKGLCDALFLHAPMGLTAGESDKALSTALLMCLGEWCMHLGSVRLLEISEYGEHRGSCLLLLVFNVLHNLINLRSSTEFSGGLTQLQDDFDPNLIIDDLIKAGGGNSSPSKNRNCQDAIILCSRTVLAHLVTHLGHFPMAIGAARLSSLVVEHDDVPNINSDELSVNIFSAPNIQLFVLTPHVIASLVELPALELPGGGVTAGLSTANKQVRVLLRDLSGKSSWDASILYRTPEEKPDNDTISSGSIGSSGSSKWGPMSFIQPDSFMIVGPQTVHLQQRAMRHRNPNVLPDVHNAAADLDQLDDLLQYLGHTSPECLEGGNRKLNEPALAPVISELEAEAIASVISERNIESDRSRTSFKELDIVAGRPASRPSSRVSNVTEVSQFNDGEQKAFQQCRLFFSQLGLGGWERRKHLHLLTKNERLLRELRNLDTQRCRETHKVAVIYVAPGQEDKNSILSNQGGSIAYEQFLASLAWEIELEGHTGFLGGLQRQGSTGLTAPYVATSFLEVIFHVATRMPGDTSEAVLNKTRHLGNDEVHLVWSEHSRDYRRDIIPTEFCDILITIYPLENGLCRVTLNCKPEVPPFGVLFDEAIIDNAILAGVVRAAVICASRAKRSTLPFYQQYYEERSRSLDTVITKHRDATTFEDFVARVYSPVATPSPFCAIGSSAGGAGDGPTCASSPSMLAIALLDSHGHSHRPPQRGDQRFNRDSRGVWFNNVDVSQNVESTSISPRPLKKLQTSLKGVPRRSLKLEQHSASAGETPPESPTQFIRKK